MRMWRQLGGEELMSLFFLSHEFIESRKEITVRLRAPS